MKAKRIIPLLLVIIIAVTALVRDLNKDISISNDKISLTHAPQLNNGWITENREITLPIKLNTPVNTEAVIYRALPQNLNNDKYLCLISSQQSIKVSVDKKVIYTYGYDEHDISKKLPGNLYNIIKLPEDAAGKRLQISYLSRNEKQSGELNTILYGYKGDILLSILRSGLYEIVAFILLTIIALVCLLISFINRKKLNSKALLYNSVLLMIISLWVFLQSSFSQFVFVSQHNVKVISYFCTMIAPIYANKFLNSSLKNDYDAVCRRFSIIYLINFMVDAVYLIISGNLPEKCLVITHIIICFNMAVVIYVLFRNLFILHKKDDKFVTLCMMPFLISSLFCIITCYTNDFVFTISRSLIIGIAFSIVFIVIALIVYFIKLYKDAMYTNVLNKLAFQDTITGGKNRTAFYKDIETTLSNNSDNKNICIMIIDLNNLKKINDTYGHLVGDEAIRTCYECIEKSIPHGGTCYRIGGDEFACILIGFSKELMSDFISTFTKYVSVKNVNLEYSFSAAYGYSYYNKVTDTNLLDAFNRADKEMYEKKQEMKNKMN